MRVQDILDAIKRIERYTAGMTFEIFTASEITIDAVIRNLEIIGEAARYIPPSLIARYPQVPWTEMRAIRNILIHAYFGINVQIIWKTITDDLPLLPALLTTILTTEEAGDEQSGQ